MWLRTVRNTSAPANVRQHADVQPSPRRRRRAEHVREELGGPVDRQVLVDQQIAAERTDPEP